MTSNQKKCYQGSYFSAYKNKQMGLSTNYAALEVRMNKMTFVDNEKGISIQIGTEGEDLLMRTYDIHIYGEREGDNVNQQYVGEDCPGGAMDCYCPEKHGFTSS